MSPSVELQLNGHKRKLVFNMNTYADYEETTGKFFFETFTKVLSVFDDLLPAGADTKPSAESSELVEEGTEPKTVVKISDLVQKVMSRISVRELRALLWAAMKQTDPKLKLEEVGSMISHENIGAVIVSLMGGQTASSPTAEEIAQAGGEVKASGSDRPTIAVPGGERSGPSLDMILE